MKNLNDKVVVITGAGSGIGRSLALKMYKLGAKLALNDLKKNGTKEGCAEGGCGACTVVLGEINNSKLIYRSINSCISFLPSINGKHLILVEDLMSNKNELHPIQEAMVSFHGSQCGFCTPGFIMSLFAMYKNFKKF